jgi:hypothetical protein
VRSDYSTVRGDSQTGREWLGDPSETTVESVLSDSIAATTLFLELAAVVLEEYVTSLEGIGIRVNLSAGPDERHYLLCRRRRFGRFRAGEAGYAISEHRCAHTQS